ncbi:MAG TPA: hypothetical protein VGB62_07725 [Allosphingosinicella sp.]|jgi:hypothetical protein
MSAYLVDPQGETVAEPPLLPVRTVAVAAIALLVIALAAILFFFWLERPSAQDPAPVLTESRQAPEPAQPAALTNERLVAAPAPTCIDGKPANAAIPAEACE